MKKQFLTRQVALASVVVATTFSPSILASDWEGSVGIGAAYIDMPWKGVDNFVTPMPILSLEYGNFEFFSNGIVSYNWINYDEFSFYTGIDYRDETYDADGLTDSEKSDDPVFDGYESPDGDVTFSTGGHWKWFSIDIQQDISGHSKGLTIDGGIEVPLLQIRERFAVTANAAVHWESSKHANYVYGIQGDQIDISKGRTEYTPGSVTSYSIGLDARYLINEQWGVFAGVSYTKLDDKIENSPLIDSDKTQVAYLGVVYSF